MTPPRHSAGGFDVGPLARWGYSVWSRHPIESLPAGLETRKKAEYAPAAYGGFIGERLDRSRAETGKMHLRGAGDV